MGERRGVDRVMLGKPKGKRPLEKQRHRWEDNIKMDLQEFGCEGEEGLHISWLRIERWLAIVNAEMHLWVPYIAGNFLTT